MFLKKKDTELAKRREELNILLTNAYGPKGTEIRDDYEKLTSGKLFRSKYFKVIVNTENWKIEF